VVAVCLSPRSGVPKYPQPRVRVGPLGIEGDYHARPHLVHPKPDTARPNHRQVTIVAQEVYEALREELGIDVPPGGFAENVLVQGLGDLSDLGPGQRLRFPSGVLLEVTGQNTPCRNLARYHPLVPRLVYGRRGVVAVVVQTGTLAPGDTVEVEGP